MHIAPVTDEFSLKLSKWQSGSSVLSFNSPVHIIPFLQHMNEINALVIIQCIKSIVVGGVLELTVKYNLHFLYQRRYYLLPNSELCLNISNHNQFDSCIGTRLLILFICRDSVTVLREKGRDLTQSYDKSPYANRYVKRAKWQHKKRRKKVRLHSGCGPT